MGTPNSRKGSGAAEAPDLEGADQGLRLVDSREWASHNATMQQAFAGNPAIASYRFKALKVSPG